MGTYTKLLQAEKQKAKPKMSSKAPVAKKPQKNEAAASVAKKPVKKPVSKEDLAAEAAAMAKEMNF